MPCRAKAGCTTPRKAAAAWRDLSAYTRACGVVMLVLFPVMGFLAMPPGAPLHAVAGLLQRLVLLAWFPCVVVLSVRLLAATRAG